MSRNNDVFKILVTKGNQAVLGTGQKVTALAPGQIGVFDYSTNLSINAAAAPATKNFYLAVGLDFGATGTTTDIAKSSGSHIQGKNMVYYSFRPHTPGRGMKVLLKDYTAKCETEYGIKLEMRNQEIYRTQGYNQFTKAYTIVTSCCEGCEPTCPSGDANEITKLLKINILNDPTGLITARAVARQALTAATHGVSADLAKGDVVSDADLEAIMAFNAAQTDVADYVYTDLEIETITQAINRFGSINLKYFYPRETVVIATKIEGFKCNGELETTQTAVFEEGAGYDLKQKEYMALGWIDSPYRLSTLNGVADERDYQTEISQKYDQIHLTYDQFSLGAWLEYYNNEATTIAIPAVDTTTRDGLMPILDALLSKYSFEPLADDASAAVTSVTTIEKTESKGATKDGISG